jgi:hypothetical protein
VGPEDVEAHLAFLKHVGELLEENGECVDAQALTPAHLGALLTQSGSSASRQSRRRSPPLMTTREAASSSAASRSAPSNRPVR